MHQKQREKPLLSPIRKVSMIMVLGWVFGYACTQDETPPQTPNETTTTIPTYQPESVDPPKLSPASEEAFLEMNQPIGYLEYFESPLENREEITNDLMWYQVFFDEQNRTIGYELHQGDKIFSSVFIEYPQAGEQKRLTFIYDSYGEPVLNRLEYRILDGDKIRSHRQEIIDIESPSPIKDQQLLFFDFSNRPPGSPPNEVKEFHNHELTKITCIDLKGQEAQHRYFEDGQPTNDIFNFYAVNEGGESFIRERQTKNFSKNTIKIDFFNPEGKMIREETIQESIEVTPWQCEAKN